MNKNTQEKAVKERKYYLELLRVIAILLVMYNHSPAFMSFQNQSGVEYGISVFLSMLCKAAAPVFFMISGALLLGKDESIGTVFRKRVLKIFLALIVRNSHTVCYEYYTGFRYLRSTSGNIHFNVSYCFVSNHGSCDFAVGIYR